MYFVWQVLLSHRDFQNEITSNILQQTLHELLYYNIIPIINMNDAIVSPPEMSSDGVSTDHIYLSSNIKDVLAKTLTAFAIDIIFFNPVT
jgi:hypothetical protein